MKLSELAQKLRCDLEGDGSLEIAGVAGIGEAVSGQLTFLSNPKYKKQVATTRASAIILGRDAGLAPIATLRSANPYLDFAKALEMFYHSPTYAPGIHPTAIVASSAEIGKGAYVGPYCVIAEDVEIGSHAVLHSFVSIYRAARIGDDFLAHSHCVVREFCQIGNRVILQNGAIIGSDGFGFAKQADGRWFKIIQSGIVVIEDDVEIQAHTCIDRGTVGETRIHRGAKLDNLVQVGHACKVGENSLLCAQVGLAGTTIIGNNCILAGQVGTGGHLKIGDGTMLTAQSGVPNDIPSGVHWSGSPAIDHRQWLKCVAAAQALPGIQKTVRELSRLNKNLVK
ncbi:MAG: UDP-3-O-(3-hydroxymyristoyl)glucosamine N-acyltransferase [Acidobacteria bacterium]|nr:UDP-3-O-(3-hydroxymyristoyl)glucosamine N-acyltransferase [Acidobacteriota bacterium]